MKPAVALLFLAANLIPLSAYAQTAALAPLTEKIEVSITNVDVTVTDSNGKPVTGLTRDDFEIFEDGVPQKLTGFYAIENATVKLDTVERTEDADQFRRKVVFMVDNNTMNRVQRNMALDYVERFIDDQFKEDYEWSVISVGPKVSTLQSFTDQKGAIHSALLDLRDAPTYHQARELDRGILSDPGRARLQDPGSTYDFAVTARFQAREQTMRNLRSSVNSARAVIQTCRAYASSAGKKLLILVTGGMELNTSFAAFDTDTDRNLKEMKREVGQLFDLMVHEANAANFSIYVINARGLSQKSPQNDVSIRTAGIGGSMQNPFFGEGYSKPSDTSDVDSSALTLALGTGGRYLPGNRVAESLETIERETATFYSLGYSPSHREDGKYHRISVRVKKPGFTVQHREGYVALSSDERFERSLRSSLSFPKDKGTLPVSLALGVPENRKEKTINVPITAAMPLARLTLFPRDDKQVGRVHVYLSIFDQQGNNVGFTHRIQDLQYPTTQANAAATEMFRYTMKVGVPKGSYTFVITLRDEVSDESGTAFQDVRL